jgi:hypothetical protein
VFSVLASLSKIGASWLQACHFNADTGGPLKEWFKHTNDLSLLKEWEKKDSFPVPRKNSQLPQQVDNDGYRTHQIQAAEANALQLALNHLAGFGERCELFPLLLPKPALTSIGPICYTLIENSSPLCHCLSATFYVITVFSFHNHTLNGNVSPTVLYFSPPVADTLLANDHPEAAALLRKQYPAAFLASDGYTALDAAIRLNALAFNK